ncbi:flagellar filament capping protein FliD [Bacillus sp. CECT 9360]|uniref:flagellar filament capping protein FliD n=1 Tax=Bacillus sp. CECT 9360 TaxID=2845821 RepID=UPI001E30C9C2|nr:flagellar filament capping protein FliD [Bacillus sp. CECT 9360]CAH0344847.1 hypothetical protein BCI9360_01117 [Bacillus sp. CECT 9360]
MVRIGGLASGMDIDQLVGDLMKAERLPLNKLMQRKQILEWQRDDYRSMNTLLLNFRSELTQMKLSSNFRARTTSSTDDSRVSITASSAANQTSNSISKVTQLAKGETQLNLNPLALDAAGGLYTQTAGTGDWKTGAIVSKSLTVQDNTAVASGGNFEYDLSLTNLNATDHRLDWSVKVNGTSYKVTTDPAQLSDNTVLVGTDGKLTFNKKFAANSVVKVDYIAQDKTVSTSLSSTTSTWKLADGPVVATGSQLKLTKNVTEGGVDTTTDVFLDIDINGNITDSTGTVGTLDKATGLITFTPAMGNHLPPTTPEAGKTYSYKLEMSYSHQYSNFQLDTHTSKGAKHENILISGGESLNSVIVKVNSSNVGASLFYDSQTKRMSLSRTETGDFNTDAANNFGYEMVASGKFVTDVLNFHDISTGSIPAANITQAQNAMFTINGLDTERTSNSFEMDGVTFTLKKIFAESEGAVSVNVNNDAGKVVENIKEFVKKYNEMIDKIQKKTGEERYRDYTPLTDEQREGLSDKQQEQWEEKAKSGLLRKDSALSSVLSKMRLDFYAPVSNDTISSAYDQLSEIGIKTSANYLEGGKLVINEAELIKAVEVDPKSIETLFNASGDTNDQKGILDRLYDSISDSMDRLKAKAGNSFSTRKQFTLGRELDNVDSGIDRFERRLLQVEDRYWRQFTAMEKAIQRSNEQMNYLMQQFSGA